MCFLMKEICDDKEFFFYIIDNSCKIEILQLKITKTLKISGFPGFLFKTLGFSRFFL